jgi:hypothetical protein
MLIRNILFTVDEKTIARELKIKEDNLILILKKEKAYQRHIYTFLNIGNENIVSDSDDHLFNFFYISNLV